MVNAVSESIQEKSSKYSKATRTSALSLKKTRQEKKVKQTKGRKYEKRNKKKTQFLDYFFTPTKLIFKGMGAPRLLKNKSGLWTGLMLFTLTWNVQGGYSLEEAPGDGAELFYPLEMEEAALHNLFKEWLDRHYLEQQLAKRRSASESSFEGMPEQLPLPLALQRRASLFEDSSKEIKRGTSSYMNLCHFKICQIGKKRNNGGRLYSRFRK